MASRHPRFVLRTALFPSYLLYGSLTIPYGLPAKRMATLEAQQLYLGMCAPLQQASVVIDNAVLDAPRLVRVP